MIVIGAGGAGLRAAIEAASQGVRVALICKSLLGKAHTVMAEGGMAAALANAGQFSKAVEVGQLALSLTDRQSPLANALQQEIAGYQAGLPYRENVKR